MKVELLYFEGCASWQMALVNLKAALQLEGIKAGVDLVQIFNDREAAQLRFLGSPSFRINDVELWSEERENYALSCRVYFTAEGIKGWPSIEMLQEKLYLMKESLK